MILSRQVPFLSLSLEKWLQNYFSDNSMRSIFHNVNICTIMSMNVLRVALMDYTAVILKSALTVTLTMSVYSVSCYSSLSRPPIWITQNRLKVVHALTLCRLAVC